LLRWLYDSKTVFVLTLFGGLIIFETALAASIYAEVECF